MASAVLASRNDAHWGERNVYIRRFMNDSPNSPNLFIPNPNPNSNPVVQLPNPNPRIGSSSKTYFRHGKGTYPPQAPPPPPVIGGHTTAFQRKPATVNGDAGDQFHREYVVFNLSSYSRAELKQLKGRFVSELDRVQTLLKRFDNQTQSAFNGSHLQEAPPMLPPTVHPNAMVANHGEGLTLGAKKIDVGKIKHPGRKRQAGRTSSRRSKKRAAATIGVKRADALVMKKCEQMLDKLMKHKHGWVFNKPVDAEVLGLRDYHHIIKNPMDLGTVKAKLKGKAYGSPHDFAMDVRLTFNNALTYNPVGTDVNVMAGTLLSIFDKMFTPVYEKSHMECSQVIASPAGHEYLHNSAKLQVMARAPIELIPVKEDPEPYGLESLRLPSYTTPEEGRLFEGPTAQESLEGMGMAGMSGLGKLPKSKAKYPNKRPMSMEEIERLGESLQDLPPEKVEGMMQILRKRNQGLTQVGDEIELDFAAFDIETLWELDRFVSSHKKVVNKMKRRGIVNNLVSAGEPNRSRIGEVKLEGNAHKKKVDPMEEDVDIGEEIPVYNFPHVEIEKDGGSSSSSSSSSSSGDSSSSSDSGSSSSSGSDSDQDSVQLPFVGEKEASH